MQKKFFFVLAAILFLGVVVSAQAAMTPNKETFWQGIANHLKMVFFPSFYSADVNSVTNPFSNPLSGYSVEGVGTSTGVAATDTSGYNCSTTTKTCSYVTSNSSYTVSKYGSKTKAESACKTACTSTTSGSATSGSATSGGAATSGAATSGSWNTSGSATSGSATSGGAAASGSWNTSGATTSGSASSGSATSGGAATSGAAASGSWNTSGAATSGSIISGSAAGGWQATGGVTNNAATSWQTTNGVANNAASSWQTTGGVTNNAATSWQNPVTNSWTNQVQDSVSNPWTGFAESLKELFGVQQKTIEINNPPEELELFEEEENKRKEEEATIEKIIQACQEGNAEKVADLLSKFELDYLDLKGVTSITADVASALSKFWGAEIYLDSLTKMDQKIAENLAQFIGDVLSFDGLISLNKLSATALAKFQGDYLYLNGLTSITKEVAKALAEFGGTIYAQPAVEEAINKAKENNKEGDKTPDNTKKEINLYNPQKVYLEDTTAFAWDYNGIKKGDILSYSCNFKYGESLNKNISLREEEIELQTFVIELNLRRHKKTELTYPIQAQLICNKGKEEIKSNIIDFVVYPPKENLVSLTLTPSKEIKNNDFLSVTWEIGNKCKECVASSSPQINHWIGAMEGNNSRAIPINIKEDLITLYLKCKCSGKEVVESRTVKVIQDGKKEEEGMKGQDNKVEIELNSTSFEFLGFEGPGFYWHKFGTRYLSPRLIAKLKFNVKTSWYAETYGILGATIHGNNILLGKVDLQGISKNAEKTIDITEPFLTTEISAYGGITSQWEILWDYFRDFLLSEETENFPDVGVQESYQLFWFRQCDTSRTPKECAELERGLLYETQKSFDLMYQTPIRFTAVLSNDTPNYGEEVIITVKDKKTKFKCDRLLAWVYDESAGTGTYLSKIKEDQFRVIFTAVNMDIHFNKSGIGRFISNCEDDSTQKVYESQIMMIKKKTAGKQSIITENRSITDVISEAFSGIKNFFSNLLK